MKHKFNISGGLSPEWNRTVRFSPLNIYLFQNSNLYLAKQMRSKWILNIGKLQTFLGQFLAYLFNNNLQ